MANINAYELLDLDELATSDEVRASYLRKAKLYHPDRGGRTEDFLNLKRAYDILLDEKQRELMGRIKAFTRPPMRIQPSQGSNLDQLLQNLDILRDKIANTSGRNN